MESETGQVSGQPPQGGGQGAAAQSAWQPQRPGPLAPPAPRPGSTMKGCLIAMVLCGAFLCLVVVGMVLLVVVVGAAGLESVRYADGRIRMREVSLGGRRGALKVVCIPVSGMIVGNSMPDMELSPAAVFTERLRRAAADDRVAGVLLYVESPGGEITAADIMLEELKRFRQKTHRPVVACLMDVAASGGYYVACGSDVIVAHPTTITGSIGVILLHFDATRLLDKIGVKDESITSGTFKDMLSPTAEKSEEQKARERAVAQDIVMQLRDRFVQVVAEGRTGLTREQVDKLADGRIFTAQQALDNKLIDLIGYQEDAIDEAKKRVGTADIQLVYYELPPTFADLFGSLVKAPEVKLDLKGSIPVGPRPMYLWQPGQ